MRKVSIFLLTFFVLCTAIGAQSHSIIIDGEFQDWNVVKTAVNDEGDVNFGIDIEEIKISNDEQFLFIYLRLNQEIDLTDFLFDQDLWLYLDTDKDANTGYPVQTNFGSELGINFTGLYAYWNGGTIDQQVSFGKIKLRVSPTVTSPEFEIAIGLDVLPDGSNSLFTQNDIRLQFIEKNSGDISSNDATGINYTIDNTPVDNLPTIEYHKTNVDDIRIVFYNTLVSGLNDNGRLPHFERIIKSLNADIYAFSETYDNSVHYVKDLLDSWVPTGSNEGWYVKKSSSDLITASKWPIIDQWYIWRQFPVLIDLPNNYEKDLLLINAHLSCCSKDADRQDQVDQLIQFLWDAKTPGGEIDLPQNTPFIYGGDLNLVGYAQQLETIVNGEIVNTAEYGNGGFPDWDNSALSDIKSIQLDHKMGYTWIEESASYPPGRLDFQIFSDALLHAEKQFILQTEVLSDNRLQSIGLEQNDTQSASDHLPVIGDYRFKNKVNTAEFASLGQVQLSPNPSSNFLQVASLPLDELEIHIYDLEGELKIIQNKAVGESSITFNVKTYQPGLYIISFIRKNEILSKRFIVFR